MPQPNSMQSGEKSNQSFWQTLTLSIVLFIFLASLSISIYDLRVNQARIRESTMEYPLWSATQLDTEFWRFRAAFTNYATNAWQVDQDLFLTRLDILWSRTNVYSPKSFAWKLLKDPQSAIETVADLKQLLNDFDERLIKLRPGDMTFYDELTLKLDQLSPRIRDLAVVTNTDMINVRISQKETWVKDFDTIILFILLTIIGGVTLIYFLYRQLVLSRQLAIELSETEELMVEAKDLAIRDPLTNLFNRRYLDETLAREIRRAKRLQSVVGVMMIDIDHFKKFNDDFGHDAGDYVLKKIGKLMAELVREEDYLCRYGGEEFTIILPGTDLATTKKRAVVLLMETRKLDLNFNSEFLGHITSSIGIALFPDHGITGESLIKLADQALYMAKSQGRDQVQVYSRGP